MCPKELKKGTSNKEGFDQVVLQNDQVLSQLMAMDEYATHNVFKRWQILIDGTLCPLFIPPTFNDSIQES
jgi:hypothetical protein